MQADASRLKQRRAFIPRVAAKLQEFEASLPENRVELVASAVARSCPSLKAYLAGNVLIIAESEDELEKYLYAATRSPYISIKHVEYLRKSFEVVCSDRVILVVDIESFDVAAIVASTLAWYVEEHMSSNLRRRGLIYLEELPLFSSFQ